MGVITPTLGPYVSSEGNNAESYTGTPAGPFLQVSNSSNQASIHLVAATGTTAPYMLGIGVNAVNGVGQVIDLNNTGTHGMQINLLAGTDAASFGLAIQNLGPGNGLLLTNNNTTGLLEYVHAQGTPAAGQKMITWTTDTQAGRGGFGADLLYVYADTGLIDLVAPTARVNGGTFVVQQTDLAGTGNVNRLTVVTDGTNGPQASFNWYSGSSGQWFSNRWISGNTTEIQLQCSDGAAAIGSETWSTLFRATAFLSTPKLAFFNVAPVAQPSAVGTATGYSAGTTAATFHSDDKYTGNTGTTAYTINGIVAALKGLGLVAA